MSHAHLVMRRDGTLAYSVEPKDNPFVPSIDVFMESCALNWGGGKGIAGILTGIGRDGAKGILALKRAGWITFAQDAETSVVYGMPKVAAEQGGAQTILPIGDVEKFLKNNVTGAMKS
jgi:chemotaxis response regulator CheB